MGLLWFLTGQPAHPRPEPGASVPLLAPEPPPAFGDRLAVGHPSLRNLPYESFGSLFKGRDAILKQIHAGFAARPASAQVIGARHAIHGLGGIGKTRLAVEYAWRYAADYRALLFVTADRPGGAPSAGDPAEGAAAAAALDLLQTRLAELAPVLRVAAGVTATPEVARSVLGWLADPAHTGWLLILDNLDDPEVAAAADRPLATLPGGHLLTTGRIV